MSEKAVEAAANNEEYKFLAVRRGGEMLEREAFSAERGAHFKRNSRPSKPLSRVVDGGYCCAVSLRPKAFASIFQCICVLLLFAPIERLVRSWAQSNGKAVAARCCVQNAAAKFGAKKKLVIEQYVQLNLT